MLPVHDDVDENNIDDTSSWMSSQETKTDKISRESKIIQILEQGDATGSDSLTEGNYLDSTKF